MATEAVLGPCYLHVASQVLARPDHFNFLPASHILRSADILLKQFGPTSGLAMLQSYLYARGLIIVFLLSAHDALSSSTCTDNIHAISLDPDQVRQNIGHGLNLNCLTNISRSLYTFTVSSG